VTSTRTAVDRAAAVRSGLYRLVARQGLHGASMGAVAKEAGVATGTAYVHYASKEDLLLATYLEVKHDLVVAAVARVDASWPAREQFEQLWTGAESHLREDPDRARFLVQVESSPYAEAGQRLATEAHGDLLASATLRNLADSLVDLPVPVLYDLALGPLVRAVAAGTHLGPSEVPTLVEACWRAVSR
jgi:TetR/AcrR family transcriptional repressor of multidrug resistance operon